MSFGTIIGLGGCLIAAFAGLWYWQQSRVAALLGGSCMASDTLHMIRYPMIFGGLGLILMVVGAGVCLLGNDQDT